MNVTPITTPTITANTMSLTALLDTALSQFAEKSILVITSKIVALCEGTVADPQQISRDDLIRRESQYFISPEKSQYGYHFTVTNNTLIASAGIDESNAGGVMVLWPRDAQKTANDVRAYLKKRFSLTHVGVLIVDSTNQPLRRGTYGISLAHSGFKELHDYRGRADLFGRPLRMTVSNVSSGLAAAAVVTMGEGDESTPLAVVADVPFVEFVATDPTDAELAELRIAMNDDLFAPLIAGVGWLPGDKVDQN